MQSEVKVSAQKGVGLYVKAVEQRLLGSESEVPLDDVRISAVGAAISTAASVAAVVEQKGWASIEKVQTSYLEMPGGKSCAYLQVDMHKVQKLKEEHKDELQRLHQEHIDLANALQHEDQMKRISGVFLGQLKYGARARSEIFANMVFKSATHEKQTPSQRLKNSVAIIKVLAGQNRLE
jgi:hypothetical protein